MGVRVHVCKGKYQGAKGRVIKVTSKMRMIEFDKPIKQQRSARVSINSLREEESSKKEKEKEENERSTIRALANCPELEALGSYLARLKIDPSKDKDVLGSLIASYDNQCKELEEDLDERTRKVEENKKR